MGRSSIRRAAPGRYAVECLSDLAGREPAVRARGSPDVNGPRNQGPGAVTCSGTVMYGRSVPTRRVSTKPKRTEQQLGSAAAARQSGSHSCGCTSFQVGKHHVAVEDVPMFDSSMFDHSIRDSCLVFPTAFGSAPRTLLSEAHGEEVYEEARPCSTNAGA